MIGLRVPPGRRHVLCLGAHPDDIEIGCGASLLRMSSAGWHGGVDLQVTAVVLTGADERRDEALKSTSRFVTTGSTEVRVVGLRDGRLPAQWDAVKEVLEGIGRDIRPDLIFAPRRDDAHQDHRVLAELVTTVWRDALVLGYEIPKWDGDLGAATHYVPVSPELARRKIELLHECFPSQSGRDWWDDETFLSLMRLRGVECRSRYAEAFTVSKAVLAL